MNNSKVAIVFSQIIEKLELICGGVWSFFITIGLLGSMVDNKKDGIGLLIIIAIIDAFGVWVFLCGIKRRKMRLEFKKYVSYLSSDPTGSLENIAAASGTSIDVVKKILSIC